MKAENSVTAATFPIRLVAREVVVPSANVLKKFDDKKEGTHLIADYFDLDGPIVSVTSSNPDKVEVSGRVQLSETQPILFFGYISVYVHYGTYGNQELPIKRGAHQRRKVLGSLWVHPSHPITTKTLSRVHRWQDVSDDPTKRLHPSQEVRVRQRSGRARRAHH